MCADDHTKQIAKQVGRLAQGKLLPALVWCGRDILSCVRVCSCVRVICVFECSSVRVCSSVREMCSRCVRRGGATVSQNTVFGDVFEKCVRAFEEHVFEEHVFECVRAHLCSRPSYTHIIIYIYIY